MNDSPTTDTLPVNFSSVAYLNWPQIPSQKGILAYDGSQLTFTDMQRISKFSFSNNEIAKINVSTRQAGVIDLLVKNGTKHHLQFGVFSKEESALQPGQDIAEMEEDRSYISGKKPVNDLVAAVGNNVPVNQSYLAKLNNVSTTRLLITCSAFALAFVAAIIGIGLLASASKSLSNLLPWIFGLMIYGILVWGFVARKGREKGLLQSGMFVLAFGFFYFFSAVILKHRFDELIKIAGFVCLMLFMFGPLWKKRKSNANNH